MSKIVITIRGTCLAWEEVCSQAKVVGLVWESATSGEDQDQFLNNFDQLQNLRKKMNLPPLDLKWDKPCVGICYMQRVRGVRCPQYLCSA